MLKRILIAAAMAALLYCAAHAAYDIAVAVNDERAMSDTRGK